MTGEYRQIPSKEVRGVGSLMQRLVYSDEELTVSLSNSLGMREAEISRLDSLAGRLMQMVCGRDDGRTIEIDGMRLKQLLDLTAQPQKTVINLNGFYDVRLGYFRMLLKKAKKTVARNARENG